MLKEAQFRQESCPKPAHVKGDNWLKVKRHHSRVTIQMRPATEVLLAPSFDHFNNRNANLEVEINLCTVTSMIGSRRDPGRFISTTRFTPRSPKRMELKDGNDMSTYLHTGFETWFKSLSSPEGLSTLKT
jgi:hypothetical protein